MDITAENLSIRDIDRFIVFYLREEDPATPKVTFLTGVLVSVFDVPPLSMLFGSGLGGVFNLSGPVDGTGLTFIGGPITGGESCLGAL